MKRKLTLLFFLFFIFNGLQAQQYSKDEETKPGEKPQKVGVRIGFGDYWLKAPELRKGKAQLGVQGAVYYRIGLTPRFDLNIELGACYRGSKFPYTKEDTGNYYTRLGLFYLEVPIQAIIALDKDKKNNLVIGPTLAYLMKPALFIRNEYYPTFTELPMKRLEIGFCIGYLASFKYVGLYLGYKHGLTNLAGDFANSDILRDAGNASPRSLKEVDPSLSNVKSIFNRSFEISLYF